MVAENFATFVRFFTDAGRNINAKNPEGKTLAMLAEQHRQGHEYAAILKSAGAK